jgi:hypothetical protein
MKYIDSFCRGLYNGFLLFGEIMIRPSTLGVAAAFLLWVAFIILMPTDVVDFVTMGLAGYFIGTKVGHLHTYLKGRFD